MMSDDFAATTINTSVKENKAPDVTEAMRREMLAWINREPQTIEELRYRHGAAWSTATLVQDFEVLGFAAPLVVVKRRIDGQLGSLFFQHQPRVYFGWQSDKDDVR